MNTQNLPANNGTTPCPDIQQPIAIQKGNRIMADPVWYRFFRNPNFTSASIGGFGTAGGATGGSTAGSASPASPVTTQATGASNVLLWLNS